MAIPLTADIALMSNYPIKVALATVVFACFIGWINACWFMPGNFIGAPGVAAGLAPVLALGVASFGMENMAFVVFLTALIKPLSGNSICRSTFFWPFPNIWLKVC